MGAIRRVRKSSAANYFAIQTHSLETFRYRVRDDEPIGWLEHPEVVDISLNTLCDGACSYCYTSATRRGRNYENVVQKIETWLDALNENDRPFQVAFGGGGEPTMHPDFVDAMEACRARGVVPNYTTNGLHVTKELLKATDRICGGVAVTAHEHLPWMDAVFEYVDYGVRTNIHVIVGKPGSAERARSIRTLVPRDVENVVLLPLVSTGFASKMNPVEDEVMEAARVASVEPGYAIGAMYAPYIAKYPEVFKSFSLYDERKYSGYLVLDDPVKMYISSFNLKERNHEVR